MRKRGRDARPTDRSAPAPHPAFHSPTDCHTPGVIAFARRLVRRLASAAALAVVIGGLSSASTPPVQAQETRLNRCESPAGGTIYTDRPCDSLGAISRVVRGVPAPAGSGPYRSGCARTLPALTAAITAAIDAHDVNGLASVYHWVGQNAQSGDRILQQLQGIADRPLVDIVVLRAAPRAPEADIGTDTTPTPSTAPATPATPPAAPPTGTDDLLPTTPRRAPAVGLRLEQTLKNSSTPSRTVFGLRRHLECWWIVL